MSETLYCAYGSTPIGSSCLAATERGLCFVGVGRMDFEQALASARRRVGASRAALDGDHPVLRGALSELESYFAGQAIAFSSPLDLRGTSFQLAVWEAVRAIPHGETRTYRQLALTIGNPRAVRVVGAANGANPLCIVVPCHRLIGSGGELRGYAGGLETKRWLLEHEQGVSASRRPPVL